MKEVLDYICVLLAAPSSRREFGAPHDPQRSLLLGHFPSKKQEGKAIDIFEQSKVEGELIFRKANSLKQSRYFTHDDYHSPMHFDPQQGRGKTISLRAFPSAKSKILSFRVFSADTPPPRIYSKTKLVQKQFKNGWDGLIKLSSSTILMPQKNPVKKPAIALSNSLVTTHRLASIALSRMRNCATHLLS